MANSQISFSDGIQRQDKRVCQRVEINKQVQLKLSDGKIIQGTTEDISLGGLRFITDNSFDHHTLSSNEQIAFLQIIFQDGQVSPEYPCNIMRCDSGSICLKLDRKKAASFGMMMTRGSLKQSK